MIQPTALGTVADIRHRFTTGQSITHDEIEMLFHLLDDCQQTHVRRAVARPVHDDYAIMVLAYNSLLHALKQAGLYMHQATPTDECGLPWVWFYRWEGSTKQGPFGTLDAALGSAILQLRSGALPKKR